VAAATSVFQSTVIIHIYIVICLPSSHDSLFSFPFAAKHMYYAPHPTVEGDLSITHFFSLLIAKNKYLVEMIQICPRPRRHPPYRVIGGVAAVIRCDPLVSVTRHSPSAAVLPSIISVDLISCYVYSCRGMNRNTRHIGPKPFTGSSV